MGMRRLNVQYLAQFLNDLQGYWISFEMPVVSLRIKRYGLFTFCYNLVIRQCVIFLFETSNGITENR